jgi:hypothetical protein
MKSCHVLEIQLHAVQRSLFRGSSQILLSTCSVGRGERRVERETGSACSKESESVVHGSISVRFTQTQFSSIKMLTSKL